MRSVVRARDSRPPELPVKFAKLPALAVLPFHNLTDDTAQDYLAEGISKNLVDRLAKFHCLPFIARGSSFAFRATDCDTPTVSEVLGARYLLEGRLRRQDSDTLLLASLANCETGQILW